MFEIKKTTSDNRGVQLYTRIGQKTVVCLVKTLSNFGELEIVVYFISMSTCSQGTTMSVNVKVVLMKRLERDTPSLPLPSHVS